jgi:hypothetical protein
MKVFWILGMRFSGDEAETAIFAFHHKALVFGHLGDKADGVETNGVDGEW